MRSTAINRAIIFFPNSIFKMRRWKFLVRNEWSGRGGEQKNSCPCQLRIYSSPSIVRVIRGRRMRWAGHVARMGEVRGAYIVLVGRPEGRRPLGKPRRRWEDNIKVDLREIGFGGVDPLSSG
jgi:hypothetical protein